MADLNLDNLGNKDYFYDYIKEETDKISDISENKLINIVKYILLQLYKLEMSKLSVLHNNIASQFPYDKKNKDHEKPILLFKKFKAIKDNKYTEEEISSFLKDNENDFKSICSNRPIFRETLFNIATLIVGFLNNQNTKNPKQKEELPKVKSFNSRSDQEPGEEDEFPNTEKEIGPVIHEDPIKPDPKIEKPQKSILKVDNGFTKTEDILISDKYNPAGIINWAMILIGGGIVVFGLGALGVWKAITDLKSSAHNNYNIITKQLGQIYTPPTEDSKDYGYLKTQFDKLFKAEVFPPKTKDSSLPKTTDPIPPVTTESNKGILSFDEIAPSLKANLDDLDKKIKELKQISEKVEVKLDDAKIKEVFNSIVKDEKSEFGKAIIKINGTGDKKPVVIVDTTSDKNKKDLVELVKNKDKLEKENKGLSDKIFEVSTSVLNLKDEVKNKNKEIGILEAKIKSIGDEKTGFKGPSGHFAILLTNSKDFELTEPILSATLVAVEKQNKENKGVQKVGIYAATGNSIDVKFSLKKGTRGLKPTEMDVANARPTETIAEVGKTFLEFAFDDGKDPIIPVDDRKAIIIATWSAGAPKNDDGWDRISQVDAILIQTPKANQLRDGSAWLDFILKKKGRLLFIQAEEKVKGGSPAIDQLQKHLSTLLNTKKD